MKKHFVTFYSPGSFVSEQTEKPIEKWDAKLAIKMVKNITERYGATPYGFAFTTRERKDDELDSKVVKKSNMYYLGGTVYTLKQLEEKNDPNDKILIQNMKSNKWDKIVENNNSWRWTQPLEKDDVVLKYNKDKE